jgi:ubiquinone biosynthesis protein
MLFKNTITNFSRASEIFRILVKYGLEDIFMNTSARNLLPEKVRLSWFKIDNPEFEYTRWELIRMAAEELGPTFIKLCQVLSNRPDIVPDELITEFEKLQDKVAPISFEEAKMRIESELGKPLQEVFSNLDEEPIGAASIGQVYKGTLISGEEVVIKVQRPNIRRKITTDIAIIREIARRSEEYLEKRGLTNVEEIIDAFDDTMSKELDYKNEARNIDSFRNYYKSDKTFYVPKVYREFSTAKVMVLELVKGCKITDIETLKSYNLNPKDVAESGMQIYLCQMFEHGFFHADPHPGNIIISQNGTINLIDFGMVGKLMKRDKIAFAGIFIGMAENNPQKVALSLRALAIEDEIQDPRRFETDIYQFIEDFANLDVGESNMADFATRLQKIIYDYKLKIPGSIFLLLRSLTILEGIGKTIHPTFNTSEFVRPYGAKLFKEQFSQEAIFDEVTTRFNLYDTFIKKVPFELVELLKKLRKDKFHIDVRLKDYDILLNAINSSFNRLVAALLIFAFTLSSSIIFVASAFVPSESNKQLGLFISILGFSFAGLVLLILIFAIMRSRR